MALTYQEAGVNIEAGNTLVNRIKPIAAKTRRPEVLASIGGFSALFELPVDRYKQPVLVSGTDGVGTKLKLAIDSGIHEGIGIDLVAMCANDLLVCGAEPLFFLDYYATGQLNVDTAQIIIESIAQGCLQSGMALVGGETAEMPGLYSGDDYDLAGFAVGVVEKSKIIQGAFLDPGDRLIALGSSGAHANGFSLIRKIIDDKKIDVNKIEISGKSLIKALLEPTQLYVKPVLAALKELPQDSIKGMSHITGGGITENLPRMLADKLGAKINTSSWKWPELFHFLQKQGDVSTEEMHRVFNCGVGMILGVPAEAAFNTISFFQTQGLKAWDIGEITLLNSDDTERVSFE